MLQWLWLSAHDINYFEHVYCVPESKMNFFFFFLKSIVELNCEAFCFGKTITNSVVFLFQDICSTMNGQHILLRIHMYYTCSYIWRIKRNFDKDKVKIIRRLIRAKSISIDVLFQSSFCPVDFGLYNTFMHTDTFPYLSYSSRSETKSLIWMFFFGSRDKNRYTRFYQCWRQNSSDCISPCSLCIVNCSCRSFFSPAYSNIWNCQLKIYPRFCFINVVDGTLRQSIWN